jgi:hypothetical protein
MNETRLFSIDSDEEILRKTSPLKRGTPCGLGIYPCVFRGVIFENDDEWRDYMANKVISNRSTNYKSPREHSRAIMRGLSRPNKIAKKVPAEFRLYNIETGEIFDLRDTNVQSQLSNSGLSTIHRK